MQDEEKFIIFLGLLSTYQNFAMAPFWGGGDKGGDMERRILALIRHISPGLWTSK
jgi:hypothetical protein